MSRYPAILRHTALACIAALLPALAADGPPARAHDYDKGHIKIGHLWSPSAKGGPRYVYGPFLNRGPHPDRLVSASSPIAGEVGFCLSPEKGGGCQPAIELAPGKPYAMAPWRAAVRLTDIARSPEEGEAFPLTLTFEKAGTIDVEVVVETAAGH